MNERLLQLYHRAPYPLKVLAASAWGYYLRRWRYGPETDQLVQEALERESWTSEKWQAWRENRLSLVLHRAATRVPYYREQWAKRRRQGDRASWEYLENWPILEKEPLRLNPKAFLADDVNMRNMLHEGTSGSTGTPIDLWSSRITMKSWYALAEARWRKWYRLTYRDRWAILGGKLVAPIRQQKPPFWVWNKGLNQLYMSSFHLSPHLLYHYLEAIKNYRIKYLLGYTSSLYALAQEVLQSGRQDLQMEVVITNAEPLFNHQRQAIARAFRCPVRETYGVSEMVTAASECEAGRLHLWPEVGIVEICVNDEPAGPGVSGNLICTGLLNLDMPLIKYRVGDRGTYPSEAEVCRCGRTLPLMAAIDGRMDDLVFSADGKAVGQQLDTLFDSYMHIREGQIIQEGLDEFRIRYVPASGFTPEAGKAMEARLQARMGPVKVILDPVPEIPREANGKFRVVVCNLELREMKAVRRDEPSGKSSLPNLMTS
jgi:phenylacetate-CoA ligase